MEELMNIVFKISSATEVVCKKDCTLEPLFGFFHYYFSWKVAVDLTLGLRKAAFVTWLSGLRLCRKTYRTFFLIPYQNLKPSHATSERLN